MRWLLRLSVAATTLVLGVAVSLFTVALHDDWWGLALGLAATAATLVALPGGWARLPFALGWCVLLVEALQVRPEGDFVIAKDPQGKVLLAAGVVVLIVGMIGARRFPAPPGGPPAAPPGPDASVPRG